MVPYVVRALSIEQPACGSNTSCQEMPDLKQQLHLISPNGDDLMNLMGGISPTKPVV